MRCARSRASATGVHVVAATCNGRTEYWAAASGPTNAVHAVRNATTSDAELRLAKRFLTAQQVADLKLKPNEVRRLPLTLIKSTHTDRTPERNIRDRR